MYAGDGENDFCPATILKAKDVLFPRNNYPLSNYIFNNGCKKELKCQHVSWDDGFIIIEELKKYVNIYLFFN
jgi:pyridoxal phosphate phosphatase PHOSPHO2